MGIAERREREKHQRRQDIIDAAEKVFFSKGLEAATMDDVAEAAELSKGTIYLYFNSKEDLYLSIIQRGLEILNELFDRAAAKHQRGVDRVLAVGHAYADFADRFSDYFNTMILGEAKALEVPEDDPLGIACDRLGERALSVLIESLEQGVLDGSIRPDIDPPKSAIILWGSTSGILKFTHLKSAHMQQFLGRFGFDSRRDLIEHAFAMMKESLVLKGGRP